MAKRPPGLVLDPIGDDFILRRTNSAGHTRSVALGEDDVLQLAQAAQSLRDRILARRSRAGAVAVLMTPVDYAEMMLDIHETEIYLTMVDRHGARLGFSLPERVAQPLAERLPVRLAQIAAAKKRRTQQ